MNEKQHLVGMRYGNSPNPKKGVKSGNCIVLRANNETVTVRNSRIGVYSYPVQVAQTIYDDQQERKEKAAERAAEIIKKAKKQ